MRTEYLRTLGELMVKVKIKDKDFEVANFTQNIQKLYSDRIKDYHLNLIKDNKALIGDEYLDLLKQHFFDVKAGAYDFGSSAFYRFINLKDEFTFFFWWLIMEKDQLINLEDVKDWLKDNYQEAKLIFEEYQKEFDNVSKPEDKKKDATKS